MATPVTLVNSYGVPVTIVSEYGVPVPFLPPGVRYDLSGATDGSSMLATHAAYAAANNTNVILPAGGVISVGSPFVLPQGVGIDFNGCTLRARTGLNGGVLQLGTTGSVRWTSAFGVQSARIDCNEVTNAIGIDVQDAAAITIDQPVIYKCVTDGIRLLAGYQHKIIAPEIFASSPRSLYGGTTLAVNSARGIYVTATDIQIIGGAIQHFRIGLVDAGSSNDFSMVHVWSTYFNNDKTLVFPFICQGNSSSFTACVPDSFRTSDNTNPATVANGGAGFLVQADRVSIISPNAIVSQFGDTLPQNNSLVLFYLASGSEYASVMDTRFNDLPGNKFKTSELGAFIAQDYGDIQKLSMVAGAGATYFLQRQYVPNAYQTGVPTLLLGGGNTGMTLATAEGVYWKTVGPYSIVKVRLILSALGSSTGAVTIGNLSVSALPFEAAVIPGFIRQGPSIISVFGYIAQGTNTVQLLTPGTGAAITNTSLDSDSEIYLMGPVWASYQATNGT